MTRQDHAIWSFMQRDIASWIDGLPRTVLQGRAFVERRMSLSGREWHQRGPATNHESIGWNPHSLINRSIHASGAWTPVNYLLLPLYCKLLGAQYHALRVFAKYRDVSPNGNSPRLSFNNKCNTIYHPINPAMKQNTPPDFCSATDAA